MVCICRPCRKDCISRLADRDNARTADCWEPLLAVADAAGGCWPEMAREAAVHIIRKSADENLTVGVELLTHIREAFGEQNPPSHVSPDRPACGP